jgi:hypothetical protein
MSLRAKAKGMSMRLSGKVLMRYQASRFSIPYWATSLRTTFLLTLPAHTHTQFVIRLSNTTK